MKTQVLKELQTIPGIGKRNAHYLYDLGIRSVPDLRNKNPESLYDRSNRLAGAKQDRCLLYVFRRAVYFSKTKHPNPKLLKWWNWKDKPKVLTAKESSRRLGELGGTELSLRPIARRKS